MTPKKLIFALWTTVVLVALVVMLTPSNDGYREFAATQFAPAKQVAASAPAELPIAAAKKEANPAAAASASPVASPAISLSGVSALLADASRATPPAAAPSAPIAANAKPAETSGQWRRASTVSKAEIEVAIQRDAMTPQTAVAFRSACNHDHDLHFDAKGKPLYACSMQIQVGPDTTPITTTPSYPLAQTFLLHSRRPRRVRSSWISTAISRLVRNGMPTEAPL
jgi:hypothetical protein